jgi:hypothetical protein
VQQTTPGRIKDGTDVPSASPDGTNEETKAPEIEDAQIVPTQSGDKDFLE